MHMERQQFYKMVPYEASASVPMVIADGRHPTKPRVVTQPTQLIDIFPTMMDVAGVGAGSRPPWLDGASLASLFGDASATARGGMDTTPRPPYVVSQFHGDNLAASWFMVVQSIGGAAYKLIIWGTGKETPSLLYNLTADDGERLNLLSSAPTPIAVTAIRNALESSLRSVVPYADVAVQVARYNHERFAYVLCTDVSLWPMVHLRRPLPCHVTCCPCL